MPKSKSFEVYYNMLLRQLVGNNDFPIEINDARLNFAVNEVIAQVTDLGPNRAAIGPDNESRYAYSQRCLQEVMKGVKHRVRQNIEWQNAVVRMGVPSRNVKAGKTDIRWIFFLMKTDDSQESHSYNDAVAALGALGSGLINAGQYLRLRSDYYVQHEHMTSEQADEAARKDMNNGGQFLFDEVSALIEDDRKSVTHFRQAALAIQRGELSTFPGGLKEAFSYFYTDGRQLSQVSDEIIDFLCSGLNFNYTAKQHATMLDWHDSSVDVKDMDSIAEQVSNPYFAIFDPFRCNYSTIDRAIGVVDNEVKTKDDLMQSFMLGILSIEKQQNREIDAVIKAYGVDSAHELPGERTESYRVFSHDGRTIILSTGKMTADNFISVRLADPVPYAVRGINERVGQLLGDCAGWSRTSRTSQQFEAVRKQLEYIQTLELKAYKKYTPDQLNAVSSALTALEIYTDDYFKHKNERHNGTKFEKQRMEFMHNVQKFAKHRRRRLKFALGHMQTVEALRQAESADGPNPKWKNNPKYAGMSAVQHNIAVALEQENARARAEREKAERPMRKARETMRRIDGDHNAAAYDTLLKSCNGPTLSQNKALILTETFIQDELARYRAEMQRAAEGRADHTPEGSAQADAARRAAYAAAKRIVAGYVITEMLIREDKNLPIRHMISNGKAEQLADIISSSAFFTERYARKISDPQSMNELIEGRARDGGLVRTEALRAGQDFMDNMQLAKQPKAPKAKEPKADEPQQAQCGVMSTTKRAAAKRYGKALNRINSTIRTIRTQLVKNIPGTSTEQLGKRLLALSVVKNMLMIAPMSTLPVIINSSHCGAFVRQVMNSDEMQQDARGIDISDSNQIRQALDNNFGLCAAYATLSHLRIQQIGSQKDTAKISKSDNIRHL